MIGECRLRKGTCHMSMSGALQNQAITTTIAGNKCQHQQLSQSRPSPAVSALSCALIMTKTVIFDDVFQSPAHS